MGKHSMKSKKRVLVICSACALLAGKSENSIHSQVTMHEGTCDVCDRIQVVTDVRDWGYFTPEQIMQAKAKLKEFGMDKHSYADTSDVKRLIEVITDVLGLDNMSYMLKLTIRGILDDIAKEKRIRLFDSRQLAYWYAKDVEFMQNKQEREQKVELTVVDHGQIIG